MTYNVFGGTLNLAQSLMSDSTALHFETNIWTVRRQHIIIQKPSNLQNLH